MAAAASDWRIVICDLNGTTISNVTPVARQRAVGFRSNMTPDWISFEVPSDDARVVGPWTDGYPFIQEGDRTVKAYRRELGGDGVYRYVIRFNGTIETVEDNGTPDDAKTKVTAFSPVLDLGFRFCRDGAGNPAYVVFTAVDGAQIAKQLVDNTNTFAGNCGVDTTGGVFEDVNDFTTTYQFQMVGDALASMADAFNGFDVVFDPLDRTDGKQVRMSCLARRGTDKPHVVFGWGIGRKNVQTIRNFKDRGKLVNYAYGFGADSALQGPISDATSISRYRRRETVETMSDVNAAMVTPLITEEISFRKQPRQLVQIVPRVALDWQPFVDFDRGDMVTVLAGPRLRGGFTGMQRLTGFDLELDDDAVERVSTLYVSPE
jgi:hypothetical protein